MMLAQRGRERERERTPGKKPKRQIKYELTELFNSISVAVMSLATLQGWRYYFEAR